MLRGSRVPTLLAALVAGVPVTGGCSSSKSTSTGASTCVYPAGPYGTAVGDVVDPSLSWQGYVDDGAQATTIGVKDYYDCDGTLGVTALLLDESTSWCVNCVNEAQQLGPEEAAWESQGVHVVTLMAQDQQTDPATLGTALAWRNEFELTSGAVCADPQWTLKLWGQPGPSGNGFPTNVLVDPRTMKIVSIQPADLLGTVQNLAASNAPGVR